MWEACDLSPALPRGNGGAGSGVAPTAQLLVRQLGRALGLPLEREEEAAAAARQLLERSARPGVAAHGSRNQSVGRAGFVRALLWASGLVPTPPGPPPPAATPALARLTARALDPSVLLESASHGSSSSASSLRPRQPLLAPTTLVGVLSAALPAWPEGALRWAAAGCDRQLARQLARAEALGRVAPRLDWRAAIQALTRHRGGAHASGDMGQASAAGYQPAGLGQDQGGLPSSPPPLDVVPTAGDGGGGEEEEGPAARALLRQIDDVLQSERLTIAEAFERMDMDAEGKLTPESLGRFLRSCGVQPNVAALGHLCAGQPGSTPSIDYPTLRARLEGVSAPTARSGGGHAPLTGDWEEEVFEAVRSWARARTLSARAAFGHFASPADPRGGWPTGSMDREQFHAAVQAAQQETGGRPLSVWELEHLRRFVGGGAMQPGKGGKIDAVAWEQRFGGVRMGQWGSAALAGGIDLGRAGWEQRGWTAVADALYARQTSVRAFLAQCDVDRDGCISIAELQRALLKLTSAGGSDSSRVSLSVKEAQRLAQLAAELPPPPLQGSGPQGSDSVSRQSGASSGRLVDVASLRARLESVAGQADTDAQLLKLVQGAATQARLAENGLSELFRKFGATKQQENAGTGGESLSHSQFLGAVQSFLPRPLAPGQGARLLRLADRDGDGRVDMEELIRLLTPQTNLAVDTLRQTRTALLMEAQALAQADGVDDDVEHGWQKLFEQWTDHGQVSLVQLQKGFAALPNLGTRLKLSTTELKKRAAACFAACDPNRDGFVTLDEFQHWLTATSVGGNTAGGPRALSPRQRRRGKADAQNAAGLQMVRTADAPGARVSEAVARRGLSGVGAEMASKLRRRQGGAAAAPFATDQNVDWSASAVLVGTAAAARVTRPPFAWHDTEVDADTIAKPKLRGRLLFGDAAGGDSGSGRVHDGSSWEAWPHVTSRRFAWPQPVRGARGIAAAVPLDPLESTGPAQRWRDLLFARKALPMEIFRAFDVDGDGFVSKGEWRQGLAGGSAPVRALLGDVQGELAGLTLAQVDGIFDAMPGAAAGWVDFDGFWSQCEERRPAPGWEHTIVGKVKQWMQAHHVDAPVLFRAWCEAAGVTGAGSLSAKVLRLGLRRIGLPLSAALAVELLRWLNHSTDGVDVASSSQQLSLATFVKNFSVSTRQSLDWLARTKTALAHALTRGMPDIDAAWRAYRTTDDALRSSEPHLDAWQRFRVRSEQSPEGRELKLNSAEWRQLWYKLHAATRSEGGRVALTLAEFRDAFERPARQALAAAADVLESLAEKGRNAAEVFAQIDADGDGYLDRAEFARALELLQPRGQRKLDGTAMEQLWAQLSAGEDRVGNRRISREQFCARLGAVNKHSDNLLGGDRPRTRRSSMRGGGLSRVQDNTSALRTLLRKAAGDPRKLFPRGALSGVVDSREWRATLRRLQIGLSNRECDEVFHYVADGGSGGSWTFKHLKAWLEGRAAPRGNRERSSRSYAEHLMLPELFVQLATLGEGEDGGGHKLDCTGFELALRMLRPEVGMAALEQLWTAAVEVDSAPPGVTMEIFQSAAQQLESMCAPLEGTYTDVVEPGSASWSADNARSIRTALAGAGELDLLFEVTEGEQSSADLGAEELLVGVKAWISGLQRCGALRCVSLRQARAVFAALDSADELLLPLAAVEEWVADGVIGRREHEAGRASAVALMVAHLGTAEAAFEWFLKCGGESGGASARDSKRQRRVAIRDANKGSDRSNHREGIEGSWRKQLRAAAPVQEDHCRRDSPFYCQREKPSLSFNCFGAGLQALFSLDKSGSMPTEVDLRALFRRAGGLVSRGGQITRRGLTRHAFARFFARGLEMPMREGKEQLPPIHAYLGMHATPLRHALGACESVTREEVVARHRFLATVRCLPSKLQRSQLLLPDHAPESLWESLDVRGQGQLSRLELSRRLDAAVERVACGDSGRVVATALRGWNAATLHGLQQLLPGEKVASVTRTDFERVAFGSGRGTRSEATNGAAFDQQWRAFSEAAVVGLTAVERAAAIVRQYGRNEKAVTISREDLARWMQQSGAAVMWASGGGAVRAVTSDAGHRATVAATDAVLSSRRWAALQSAARPGSAAVPRLAAVWSGVVAERTRAVDAGGPSSSADDVELDAAAVAEVLRRMLSPHLMDASSLSDAICARAAVARPCSGAKPVMTLSLAALTAWWCQTRALQQAAEAAERQLQDVRESLSSQHASAVSHGGGSDRMKAGAGAGGALSLAALQRAESALAAVIQRARSELAQGRAGGVPSPAVPPLAPAGALTVSELARVLPPGCGAGVLLAWD